MIDKDEIFRFLDEIRSTGKINMFGAEPYISEVYDISKKEAQDLLVEWMKTFSERNSHNL